MNTTLLDAVVRQINGVAATADDIDPAFQVFFEGASGTTTAEWTSTSIILIDPTNGTTTIAHASKTSATMAAAIEAIPGWHYNPIGTSPLTLLKPGGTTGILIQAAADASLKAGLTFFWDTSLILSRRLCLGDQAVAKNSNGLTRSFYARDFRDTFPITRDPIRGNTGGLGQAYTYAYAYLLKTLYGKATATGGFTIRAVRCDKTREIDAQAWVQPTTATKLASGVDFNLGERFKTAPGQYIYLEICGGAYVEATTIGSATITVVTFDFAGDQIASS